MPRVLIHFAAPIRRQKSPRRMHHTPNLAALKHGLRVAKDEVHLTLDIAVVIELPRNLAWLDWSPRSWRTVSARPTHPAALAGRQQRVLIPQQPHVSQHSPIAADGKRERLSLWLAGLRTCPETVEGWSARLRAFPQGLKPHTF